MHATLQALFDSPQYDRNREHIKDGIYGQDTPRTQAVNKIIDIYRRMAESTLIRENPELWEQIKEAYMNNRASKAGVTPDKNSTDTMTKQESRVSCLMEHPHRVKQKFLARPFFLSIT